MTVKARQNRFFLNMLKVDLIGCGTWLENSDKEEKMKNNVKFSKRADR